MKTLLAFLLLMPAVAMAQSASVPVMGTAPSQPAATQTPPVAPTPQAESRKPQKKAIPVSQASPKPAKPVVAALPLPSQVTKDFYEAFTHGNLQLAEMLLQQGADINCRNCGKLTTLVYAVKSSSPGSNGSPMTLIQWLLSHGADINLFDSDEKTNPLNAALSLQFWSRESTLFLLQKGSDPRTKNIEGYSPFLLFGLVFQNNFDYWVPVFGAMMEAGADINQVNVSGYSSLMNALSQAVSYNRSCAPDVVKAYLDRGANVDIRALDGMTAADLAYKGALAGGRSCNEVYATLKSFKPGPSVTTTTNSTSVVAGTLASQSGMGASSLTGEWQGVFNATSPRQGSVSVTSVFSRSGEVIFSSQSGLRGSGRLNVAGGQLDGNFTAKSPLDAQGKPVFTNPDGSTDILFTLNGSLTNGIMRGKYTSAIESGNFVMCDDANYKQNPECRTAQGQGNPAGLFQAVGGLLGVLKGLSGK